MYKNIFDKEITQGIIYNSYMFYGQSDYLIEKYSTFISQSLAKGEDVFKIYFDDYNLKECSDYLSQSSLFAPLNILLIKTVKKIPKDDVIKLIDICNKNSDSFVIFCCIGDTDFKTMAKSFTKKVNGAEVRFFQPNDREAIDILKKEMQKYNLKLGFGELEYLYNMHQKDLNLAVNDLNKLSILDEEITVNIINNQCFAIGEVDIDEFFHKLFRGENIANELNILLESGLNEIALVTQTTGFLQQLFNIKIYVSVYQEFNIQAIWGYPLPKYIATIRKDIAMKFTINQFKNMFNFFQTIELDLKTNNFLDKDNYTQIKFRKFAETFIKNHKIP